MGGWCTSLFPRYSLYFFCVISALQVNIETSEIFSEFFETYRNVFCNDYHSWNPPLTISSVISLSAWCMCVCVWVFCLLAPVLFEEPSLAASNQQIYDLYK